MSNENSAELLFAALAAQLHVVTREQLLAAIHARKDYPRCSLAEVLQHQHVLEPDRCHLIKLLVNEHLSAWGNDAERSLSVLPLEPGLSAELSRLGLHGRPVEPGEVQSWPAMIDSGGGVPAGPPGNPLAPEATDNFDLPAEQTGHASSPSAGTGDRLQSTGDWPPGSVERLGGRFRVLRSHAEGGISRVSVALDEELHREVAFKELLPARANSLAARARLLLEGEITGALEHPGVVPVYGMGSYADGRPFYAMRFVRGQSLKAAIAEFHQSASNNAPSRHRLEFRRLLAHLITVCNAVHYAHSRGILHRDLKPDNIMLGRYGETLVVDWGLAKVTGDVEATATPSIVQLAARAADSQTEMGSVLGTPAYMSPEQASGRHDQLGRATDIYSLGATLYCLLVNQPPFAKGQPTEILEQVRRGEFRRPREISASVPRPLEAICLKAMRLAPEERYATAADLADDIENWLADEAVSAYREPIGERLGRWSRRHRSLVRTLVGTVMLVTAIGSGSAILVNRARQEAVELASQNAILALSERTARQDALQRLQESRAAVDTWLTGTSEALAYYPGIQQARNRLLHKAVEHYERFARQQSNNPDLELERGRAYLRLGDVQRLLGKRQEAEQAFRAAGDLLAALVAAQPESTEPQLELANCWSKTGLLLAETGRNKDAEAAADRALAAFDRLQQVPASRIAARESLGACRLNRAHLLLKRGDRSQAEQELHQAAAQFESLITEQPDELRHRASLAIVRSVLARTALDEGRVDEAKAESAHAVALLDTLVKRAPHQPKYVEARAAARIYQAQLFRRIGGVAEEREAYQRAAADYQLLVESLPDVPRYREQQARAQLDLAQLLYDQGDRRGVEAELDKASPVLQQLASAHPQVPRYREERAACHELLGQARADLGKVQEAEDASRSAVECYNQLVSAYPDVADYRQRRAIGESHLGQILWQRGQVSAAEAAMAAALGELRALQKADPAAVAYRNELAHTLRHQGNLFWATDRKDRAAESYREAGALWQELLDSSATPEYQANLAWLLARCPVDAVRRPTRAAELALAARKAAPQNAECWAVEGAAQLAAGQPAAALTALGEACRRGDVPRCRDEFLLALAQAATGDRAAARETLARAEKRRTEQCPAHWETGQLAAEACQAITPSNKK